MNYSRHYYLLIDRARNRVLNDYSEKHHIIPKCMGGTDDKSNLVRLTPEEHYVAHQLLIKMHPGNHKLVFAAAMMCVSAPEHRNKRTNNRVYGWIRKRYSIAASINGTGPNGSQYGTCWIYNLEEKVSKKIPKSDVNCYLADGWILGRVINFNKPKKALKRSTIKEETDKRYLDALLQSTSISGALRLLGQKTAGAGYARMKSVIIKNNLQDKFCHEHISW
jgi:hypothetical protein